MKERVKIPGAWIAFLLAAESQFATRDVEDVLIDYRNSMSASELAEMGPFLQEMARLSESECRRAISHPEPAVDVNLFKPRRCRAFYDLVQRVMLN